MRELWGRFAFRWQARKAAKQLDFPGCALRFLIEHKPDDPEPYWLWGYPKFPNQ